MGAFLNVKINVKDPAWTEKIVKNGEEIERNAAQREAVVLETIAASL